MSVIYQFVKVQPPGAAAVARERARLAGVGAEAQSTEDRIMSSLTQAARASQPIVEALARRGEPPQTQYEYLEPAGGGGGAKALLTVAALAAVGYVGYRALAGGGGTKRRRATRRRRYR